MVPRPSAREVALVGAQLYAFLAMGVAFLLASRWLGAEAFGVVATLYSAAILVGTLLHLSVGQAALIHAGKPHHGEWLAASVRAARLLSLAGVPAGALAGLVLWALGVEGLPAASIAALAALVPLSMWDYFAAHLLSSADRTWRLVAVLAAGRTAMAGGALAGAALGPAGVLAGLAAGLAVSLALTQASLRGLRRGGTPVPATAPVRSGLALHAGALGSIVIAQGPVLLLARLLGPAEAGQYALAFQFLAAFLVIPSAGSLALGARISRSGPDAAWRGHVALTAAVCAAMLALAGAAWVLQDAIRFVFGPTNALAVRLFLALLPALAGWPAAILLAPQWVARGLLAHTSAITVGLAAASVGLCLLLVPAAGAVGAAWATSATFLGALAANLALAGWVRRSRAGALAQGPGP